MLRDGYNVQFEGTIVRTTQEATLLRENNVQRDQGWSWIVLFAAFLTLFITNGMHASFGILYANLVSHFNSGREETAWIGSISLGLLCFFSPVASVLIEQIGCRATSIIGAFLCSLGFFISSFATGIALLYFSHGLLFGLGTSLTYTAAMTVVTRSFERRRNIATGLFTSGSQFGGISLAPLSQVLFDRLGYANTFRTFSGVLLAVAISSLVYRSELGGTNSGPTSAKKSPKDMLNVWKSKAYIVWVLGTTIVTLGYNIPRYTLAKYASDQGISKDASAWLVSYLCAASAIGRIIFGRLCEWVPTKLYLCQACIVVCAICAFLIPFLKSYLALVITCILLGLPDGGFVAALSLVTTEIVGPEKMVEGFGFMLFCQSYSNALGPPLSGMLYDTYKSYKAAFCFAAVPEIIGALILFLIPYYRRNQVIKYTHEIEYNSNSGILVNGNSPGAGSTLNPISEVPILSTSDEPQGEYNVVINLTSDNPDIRLVNVVIHKATGTATGATSTDFEIEQAIQGGGIINKAAEVPVSTGECLSAPEGILEDQPGPQDLDTSVVIEPRSSSMLSVVGSSPMKSCSTQTVIHDIGVVQSSAEAQHTNNSTQTVNLERVLPALVAQSVTPIDQHIIDVGPEQSAPGQTFPSKQLVAIVANEPAQVFPNQQLVTVLSNDSQTDLTQQNYEAAAMINLGPQIKTSDKSLPIEASASVVRVSSNAVCEGHDNPLEEIINISTEPDVPKISPPPPHKHHVTNAKIETMDITGCHANVVESTPEAMLAELDTFVQENELVNPCLTQGFTAPEVNNQQASLMNCTGFTSEINNNQQPSLITGFTPEPVITQQQESLMLSNTFIPEMTSPCLSTAFSTAESSRMTCGGMSDALTQKQLPEPLKPTSLSSVRGNEQLNSQDVAPATSPLSCELSTVIADVIQSLTSQHTASQKSNKESTISSNMADNPQEISDATDHLEKKQVTVTENPKTKEPKLNIEPASQASSELSSYCKLQTSVLHSMQSIVAEGCPEDVALLEDISIDLTLDKDPSFASIVLIDDVEEQNNTTDLNFPCLSHEPPVTHSSRISGQEQHFSGLSHAFAHSSVVPSPLSHEPAITHHSVTPTQSVAHELTITHLSGISNQEQHPFSGLSHEPTIVPSNGISGATDRVLQDNIVLELFSTSGDLVVKPIESTNPFYHDINQ